MLFCQVLTPKLLVHFKARPVKVCLVCSICFQVVHFQMHHLCTWYHAIYFSIYCCSVVTVAVPYFQKLQREGESGRKKINQITRYLTVLLLLDRHLLIFQMLLHSCRVLQFIHLIQNEFSSILFLVLFCNAFLISGTLFVMWLGEKITDKGIGNGISLIIMIGIIARLPFALFAEFISRVEQQSGGLVVFVVEIIILILVYIVYSYCSGNSEEFPCSLPKELSGTNNMAV
jgi:preprotein translocase subunit SecY